MEIRGNTNVRRAVHERAYARMNRPYNAGNRPLAMQRTVP